MSGGKGGSQTTEVQIPQWLEDAAKENLAYAKDVNQIGYVPYYGPDVAAQTPLQQAAMQNTAGAAQAFGMAAPTDFSAGMPQAQDYGGMAAYSAAPMYEQSLAQLQAQAPGQYGAIRNFFVDPVTGLMPGEQPVTSAAGGGKGGALDGMIGQGGRSGNPGEYY